MDRTFQMRVTWGADRSWMEGKRQGSPRASGSMQAPGPWEPWLSLELVQLSWRCWVWVRPGRKRLFQSVSAPFLKKKKKFIEFITVFLLFHVLVFHFVLFGWKACGILAPSLGIEPSLPVLEVPTIGLPETSWVYTSKTNQNPTEWEELSFSQSSPYCLPPSA